MPGLQPIEQCGNPIQTNGTVFKPWSNLTPDFIYPMMAHFWCKLVFLLIDLLGKSDFFLSHQSWVQRHARSTHHNKVILKRTWWDAWWIHYYGNRKRIGYRVSLRKMGVRWLARREESCLHQHFGSIQNLKLQGEIKFSYKNGHSGVSPSNFSCV